MEKREPFPRWLMIPAILAILSAGAWFYHDQERRLREDAEKDLLAIAQLKVDQIAAWRAERLADAAVLMSSQYLVDVMTRWLAAPEPADEERILSRFQVYQTERHYRDALLVDSAGEIRLSLSGVRGAFHGDKKPGLAQVWRTKKIALTDLHIDDTDSTPHVSVIAPFYAADGAAPAGAVILVSDARQFLYPLIQSWPIPTRTAETLLVQRDGGDVLFLNDLRHQAGTALTLRIPLSRRETPAVMAVLGKEGIVYGKDYREVDVVAALKPIPDSPWFLVAKRDVAEVFAGWRQQARLILALTTVLVLATAALIGMIWQRNNKAHYRDMARALREQQATEARFRDTLDSMMEGCQILDHEWRYIYINDAAAAHGRRAKEELLGRTILECYPGVEETPLFDAMRRCMRERTPCRMENEFTYPDGSKAWFELSIQPAPEGVFILSVDITEQKRAELLIRRHDAINAALAELCADLLKPGARIEDVAPVILRHARQLTGSEHGFVASIDPKTGDMIAHTLTAMMGNECQVTDSEAPMVFPKDPDGHYRGLWGYSLNTREPFFTNDPAGHFAAVGTPEGHILLRNLLAVPVVADDELVGQIAVANAPNGYTPGDIEPVRRLGELYGLFLRDKHLQDILKEKEEHLRQAQRMESIGRLAGGVAHDFNNLLSVINGYADFTLAALPEDSDIRHDIQSIREAGDRAAALTRQLLAFSRKQILQPLVLNLNRVVEDMEKMLRRLIGEDIEIDFVPAPDLGQVKLDPAQLDQVIMNLVVNARDAMPTGGKLTIETLNVDLDEDYAERHAAVQPGPYVMLAISDTGVGMSREILDKIFDPFFTTKEQGKGTGLGLAMVYGIVKQSGGNIYVYSEPGEGTTFKLYFPRVEEETPASRPAAVERDVSGTETILVVEDEDTVRDLVRLILTRANYTVFTASNGDEALAFLERHEGPLHLMLTDVVMPGLSGRSLTERIAALQPGMKVLYMSGYTDNAIIHHGVLDADVQFIAKPFTATELRRKVRAVLDMA